MYKHERYIVCFLTQDLCKIFPCRLPSFSASSTILWMVKQKLASLKILLFNCF